MAGSFVSEWARALSLGGVDRADVLRPLPSARAEAEKAGEMVLHVLAHLWDVYYASLLELILGTHPASA